MNRKISPSLLSANFTRLKQDIELVEKLGVDRLHLDVMDGHFVPNLTFGPFIIKFLNLAGSKGFCPPWGTNEPPTKVMLVRL